MKYKAIYSLFPKTKKPCTSRAWELLYILKFCSDHTVELMETLLESIPILYQVTKIYFSHLFTRC